MKYTSAIIIPCYNEYARLPVDGFVDHLKLNPQHALCFVNDGSNDGTNELLEQIKKECTNAYVLSLDKNEGKASAVFHGMQHALKNIEADFYGYLDADLATPLSFISIMENEMEKGTSTMMIFGSRHLADKNSIERKAFRHYSGRLVSKMITWALGVKYGDTQCGAKLLSKEGVELGFDKPFSATWVFDVELIKRLINYIEKKEAPDKIKEIAVNQWKDVGNSKVSMFYFFKMFAELRRIKKLRRSS